MANEANANNSEIKQFFVHHGTKFLVALVAILVVVAGVVQVRDSRRAAAAEQAELLGTGMTLLYAGEKDSALTELESKINGHSLEGLALAKACLYAGNIKYEKGDFDGAAALFPDVGRKRAGESQLRILAAVDRQIKRHNCHAPVVKLSE